MCRYLCQSPLYCDGIATLMTIKLYVRLFAVCGQWSVTQKNIDCSILLSKNLQKAIVFMTVSPIRIAKSDSRKTAFHRSAWMTYASYWLLALQARTRVGRYAIKSDNERKNSSKWPLKSMPCKRKIKLIAGQYLFSADCRWIFMLLGPQNVVNFWQESVLDPLGMY